VARDLVKDRVRSCVKTEHRAVDTCDLAGCQPDGVGAYGPEHAGVGGGRGSVLCGSLVKVEIGWAFFRKGLVEVCLFSNRIRPLGGGCRGMDAIMLRNSDFGGCNMSLSNSRAARSGNEQGDQECKSPYQHGEPGGRGRRHR
jgi:hypothetical protein